MNPEEVMDIMPSETAAELESMLESGSINSSLVQSGIDSGMMGTGDATAAFGLMAFGIGMIVVMLILAIGLYIYMAICLMKIAKKTNTPNAWLAWIPIANFVLMLQIAGRPIWWLVFLLFPLIPIVGVIALTVIYVIVWMGICEKLGREKWLGILIIVPIANLILPGYLAFSKSTKVAGPAKPEEPKAA